jgi:hypothetical protein
MANPNPNPATRFSSEKQPDKSGRPQGSRDRLSKEFMRETPETMREKLRQFRDLDPYRKMFCTLLPLDALPSDALSDRQLDVICDVMVKALARLARKRGLIQ